MDRVGDGLSRVGLQGVEHVLHRSREQLSQLGFGCRHRFTMRFLGSEYSLDVCILWIQPQQRIDRSIAWGYAGQ